MHFVVIGSGIAGVTFAEEMRKRLAEARITLLTRETHGYYSRPLLSHGFTRVDIEDRIVLKSFSALEKAGIEVRAGVDVRRLVPGSKVVEVLENTGESTISYDKLVLATGSDAFIPPSFRSAEAPFHVLNSLDDLKGLRAMRNGWLASGLRPKWAVVGGGLIGCELASDLATAGDAVHLFHSMPRLMERQLVEEDARELLGVLRASRIEISLDCAVRTFERRGDRIAVLSDSGEQSGFDAVIVACGFSPRTDLARQAGLAVNRGIRVDTRLRSSDPDIHAVGDVAECSDHKIYAYVTPIRNQAVWLADHLAGAENGSWTPPFFKPKAKVHGFDAKHPYLF